MKPLICSLFNNNDSTLKFLLEGNNFEKLNFNYREFPDKESYIQILSEVKNRNVIILDSLFNPNEKILPLILFVETLKDLGAKKIGLLTPYLPYMRQDKRFKKGEGVTSRYFAKLISNHFDWLVTIDSHLHRYNSLSEIYSIPTTNHHSAPAISKWILNNVDNPVIIGPDSESEQWVKDIAGITNLPFTTFTKSRHGDYDVEISAADVSKYSNHTPVLVDDIISTARTMIKSVAYLNKVINKQPVCIGVHAVFHGDAYQKLQQSGVLEIATCNSIKHESNKIPLDEEISISIINGDDL